MASAKGFLAVLSAVALCPCHLPLFAGVFAGTALGATISENYNLLVPVLGAYFIAAVFVGVRWLTRDEAPVCEPCETGASKNTEPRQAVTPRREPAAAREPVGTGR